MTKKPTTAQEEKSEGIVAKAKAFRNYLELSKTELRKVTWPTVKETRTTSLVVLAFVVVMAIDRHMKNAGNASNARGIPCICKETSALIAAAAYFRSVC